MDINSLKLEKFEGYGTKVSRDISITKSFSFGIPPAFYKENGLEKYSRAILYFDKEAKIVAIEFANGEDGFKLNKYGDTEKIGASFVARSFFNTYDINLDKYSGKYSTEKNAKSDGTILFLLDLKEREQEIAAGQPDES